MAYPYDSQINDSFIKIPNPYHPYDIESGKWFYHKDVIRQIKKEFESKPRREVIVIQGIVGTGKTSTLKRMVDDRDILGEGYIPIYLDLGEIKSVKMENILFSIYQDIKNAMGMFGFQIDGTNFWLSSTNTLSDIKTFIDKIEEMLIENNIVIVLILDDFEYILETKNLLLINSMVKFFQYIIYETDSFRLILAGRGEISELAKSSKLSNFLNSARFIDLDLFLAIETIKNLIVEPAKGYFTYEPEAINEIIEITGRNLHCQQLLCHYIVNYLNQEKRNICVKKDVQYAAKMMINDEREDFSYFWHNLPYECQLVASALTDESVTKKKGRFYFLEDESLLYAIFDEKTINKILIRLADDGYINEIIGKRFDVHPYKMPLVGEWVKKTHSLLQTVVENWERVTDHISLSELGRIFEMIPIEMLPIERETIRSAVNISLQWSAIKTDLKKGRINRDQINGLVQIICDILAFDIKAKPKNTKTTFTINMNRLDLSELENVLLFAPPTENPTDLDIQFIQDEILRQDKPGNPSFILCFNKSERIQKLAQKRFLGLVLIEENDLKNFALSSRPLQVFKQDIIIRQVKPSVVSPYKTEGPVKGTFYGRQDEIGRILGTKVRNFAIVGARKIGKTSLLFKIITEVPSTTIPIYIDLETPQKQNYVSFLSIMKEKIKEEYKEEVYFADDLSNLASCIKYICQKGKKPVFFLDEIDSLLKFDKENDFPLLTIFRSLAQERYCQVIISGFEDLYLATKGIGLPLYNFCEIIRLNELRNEDALALITEPMMSIGIKYDNPDDIELILKYTSCHPNLIQFFCKGLVERIQEYDEKRDIRTIFKKDIEEIYKSYGYERYIINDFYLFFREDVRPIERLIVLLLLEKDIITVSETIKILKSKGIIISIGKVVEHLSNLCLRYIFIAESGGKYRFALPIFREILKRRYDLENLIEEAIDDAKKSL